MIVCNLSYFFYNSLSLSSSFFSQTAKAITGSDSYTYLLNHTGSGYLIASMRSKEQIIFNPLFDVKGGTIMEAEYVF